MTSAEICSTVRSRGIYRGLPCYSDSITGLDAIVAGSNGISGQGALRVLVESPKRWTRIFALSRRPPSGFDHPLLKHISLDLDGMSEEDILEMLKKSGVGTKPTYIFYFAYKEIGNEQTLWDPEKMSDVNAKMLRKLVSAFESVQKGANNLNWVVLQTGAKQFGMHLGPVCEPCHEGLPRVNLQPNFYYAQENVLLELSKGKSWDFAVSRPGGIIGASKDSYMNLAMSLAMYCAVSTELGNTLEFFGNETAYRCVTVFSDAKLLGYFAEWLALEPKAGGEGFNAMNGDEFSFSRLFRHLSLFYGLTLDENVFSKPPPLPFKVPYDIDTPDYYWGPKSFHGRIQLTEWVKKENVQAAWKKVAERYGIDKETFQNMTWEVLQFAAGISWSYVLDMGKARKFGWNGFVDTWDSFRQSILQGEELGFLPPHQGDTEAHYSGHLPGGA